MFIKFGDRWFEKLLKTLLRLIRTGPLRNTPLLCMYRYDHSQRRFHFFWLLKPNIAQKANNLNANAIKNRINNQLAPKMTNQSINLTTWPRINYRWNFFVFFNLIKYITKYGLDAKTICLIALYSTREKKKSKFTAEFIMQAGQYQIKLIIQSTWNWNMRSIITDNRRWNIR